MILYCIMNQCPRGLTVFAPDCSSWGTPARGSSYRSYINAEGLESYDFVKRGNVMVSRPLFLSFSADVANCFTLWFAGLLLRLVLAILLILSRNGLYLIEQPSQSLLYVQRRVQWLANRVSYAGALFDSLGF